MAEYEEDEKDNETSTSDIDNETSGEYNKDNPTSDDNNEIDRTSTITSKKNKDRIEQSKVHENDSQSSIVNLNNRQNMIATNMYGCSYENKDQYETSSSLVTEENSWMNPLMYSSHYYSPSLISAPISNATLSTSAGHPYNSNSTNQTICTSINTCTPTTDTVTTSNHRKYTQKTSNLQNDVIKRKNVEKYDTTDLKKFINERFDKMEDKFKTLEILLHGLQTAVQPKAIKMPKIPDILPINSSESLLRFQNCSNEEFNNCVSYFTYIGGFNPKECASLIIKKAFTDDYAVKLTWTGYGNTTTIAPLKITTAICQAILRNDKFPQPSLMELQNAISEGLRNAKQRVRNKDKENKIAARGKRSALTEIVKDNLSNIEIN